MSTETDPITTTDLKEFGYRELAIARDLLTAMLEDKFSDAARHVFKEADHWVPWLNKNSGEVFLSNEDNFEVLMLRTRMREGYEKEKILAWFNVCRDCGNEADEFGFHPKEGCEGCKDQIDQIVEARK